MLQTESITIEVTSEAARAFREVSIEDRKKLELLLKIMFLKLKVWLELLNNKLLINQLISRKNTEYSILEDFLLEKLMVLQ